MLYSEIMAVCSEIRTKHINTLCGHNEEILNSKLVGILCTHYILKSRKSRRAGHVARMGERHTRFWRGKLRERNHLEDPSVDGRIILRWICRKQDVGTLTGLIWVKIGTGGGLL